MGVILLAFVAKTASSLPLWGVGVLEEGETQAHIYDAHQDGCYTAWMVYTVELTYAPPMDTLVLRVNQTFGEEHGQVGEGGAARIVFWDDWCTDFVITVEGTEVFEAALYWVSVSRDYS